jgi:hypothetical protein
MAKNLDKYYTELDKELQQLALVDWATFVELIGHDAVLSAKICMLKSRGLSLNQIGNRLSVTRRVAQVRCEKCTATGYTLVKIT